MIQGEVIGDFEVGEINLRPLMEDAAALMFESQMKNWDVGGRPTWAPLKTGEPSELFRTGALKIETYKLSGEDWAEVGNMKPYAPYLQYGTKHMIAREFILWQDEDIDMIEEMLGDYFEAVFSGTTKTGKRYTIA